MMGEALSARERRAARTREAILDAARELISERGAHGFSLREVARRIDYSPAGLYEYFGNKDELVAAVVAQGFERFSRYLLSVPTSLPPRDYLLELGMAYIRFALENPQHFMLIFNTPDLRSPKPDDEFIAEGTHHVLVNGIQRCLDAGEISNNYRRDDLVFAAWATVHGMSTLIVSHLSQDDHDWLATSRTMLEAWCRGLRPSP
ncbi:MAG: TetR/AcrR family transcriptional regulator [Anaerolineales bacterium]|nr:TetR/AcrR family transcriptional regulator [Anaerolineales bacterium]